MQLSLLLAVSICLQVGGGMPNKVFVGGLAFSVDDARLAEYFQDCPGLTSAEVRSNLCCQRGQTGSNRVKGVKHHTIGARHSLKMQPQLPLLNAPHTQLAAPCLHAHMSPQLPHTPS